MCSCQLLHMNTASPSALELWTSAGARSFNFAPSRRIVLLRKEQVPWRTRITRMSARVPGSADGNNGSHQGPRKNTDFFVEEAIGAEHGEGFATYRPRGPLHVDVDYLNDRMRERGLQRIRYAMKPDEAFGLIYSWDNVIADTRALRIESWNRLANEEGKTIDNDLENHRQLLSMTPSRAMEKVLYWGETGGDIERLTKRLAVIYSEALARVRTPMEGVREWLEALDTAGVPCAVASSLDRLTLLAALERMGLRKYFQAVVSEEDGMDSIAHRFLSAAVKLDRPPFKCVVFEDNPRGITAAHNCTMKAVALIGSHPAYDLTQADLAVSSFTELSVINLRRLFANKGTEFMDLQKQPEEKKPRKRKITNDTLF
ncbi:hypothetical protein MPTK1_7g17320 [Marchantia polymorpha subsp. ruderalis]|uniref:Uncharacterized protein n=2 Tax=Marchantia polymorpha TaxID=3197 RepID=A0AAF6C0Q9_MARPO|nr:hypothetical protein MARPO_0051s0069 [Marchantia polymorpha]BBN17843.1 hypothetical protein Mp_7g17320 [Marchantia polymorpha subsp. ruderalis]|eukprot:PTQ38468.1 hypothetical protein MARPO_0051s0069 [Marchantia polymorpha]